MRAPVPASSAIGKMARRGSSSNSSKARALYNSGVQARRRGDLEDAADCFRRAARAGHAKAMVNLGSMYEKGEGVGQDDTQAVHFFRAAAELNNIAAMFALGMHLKRGTGVEGGRDDKKAWVQLSRAAEGGHAGAQYNLALMHQRGTGCALDLERAMVLYEQAAAQGHAKAMVNLGSMLDKKRRDAARAERRAERREAGRENTNPHAGTGMDDTYATRACALYRKALEASAGDSANDACAIAKYNLSCNMKRGHGIDVDEAQALELLNEAASDGVPQAQYNLAKMILQQSFPADATGNGHQAPGATTARGSSLPTVEEAKIMLQSAAAGGAEKASRALARMETGDDAGNDAGAAGNDALEAEEMMRRPGVRGAPSAACRARVRAAAERRRQRLRAQAPAAETARARPRQFDAAGVEISDSTDDEEDNEEREAMRRRRREHNRQRLELRDRRRQDSQTERRARGGGTRRQPAPPRRPSHARDGSLSC